MGGDCVGCVGGDCVIGESLPARNCDSVTGEGVPREMDVVILAFEVVVKFCGGLIKGSSRL